MKCFIMLLFLFSANTYPLDYISLKQQVGTDTSWISNSRFVIRTIKLDTIKDTFDYVIIKLQHPIDWELMLEDVQKTIDKKGK